MARLFRFLGVTALFLGLMVLFARFVLPLLLDRSYYRGPATGHFDGERFRNPEGEFGTGGSQRNARNPLRFTRFILGGERTPWPASAPVRPVRPAATLPCVAGSPPPMRVTWIGHATALVQVGGLAILTDPIWAERASPVSFAGPRRSRAPGVALDALPRIDLILVSHNHYDHMDLDTLGRLWRRDRPVIVTGLGNDTILRGAGIPAVARDWGGRVTLAKRPCPGGTPATVVVERVHHWSSRLGADRNRALWSGFTVLLPGGNLFFAGDTGFGDGTWADAAGRRGPIRLALLPIGAYRPRGLMSGNHVDPGEAAALFVGLGAARALGIHWGTFPMAGEGMDDPPPALAAALARRGVAAGRFRTVPVGGAWDVPAVR